jgi:hypothetical protein
MPSEIYYKTYIPAIILFLVGLIFQVETFFKVPTSVSVFAGDVKNIAMVIAAFGLAVGGVNIFLVNGRRIINRTPGQWYYAIWLIIIMFAYIIVGLAQGTTSSNYTWLFETFFVPINQTMYALIGLYLIAAMFYAFRIRNLETSLMVIVSCITLLGRAPLSEQILPQFVTITNWIRDVPNVGASRAIRMIGAIGMILIGMRTLAGMERGAMGGAEALE